MNIFKQYKTKKQFDQWIIDFHNGLYKHAFWMTGNHDMAMDAVQETFYQAWLSIDKLKHPEKAFPWFLTILRRAVYREQRYQYRQHDTVDQLLELEPEASTGDAYSLLVIYQMLENISLNHREVFLLYYLHGFSYEEIADHLQIPSGTVMSRLARAREALQKMDGSSENKIIYLNLTKREKRHDS